jgi:NIMA (never in mitosis gene a)-related kinase 1/4/5
MEYCDGGDLNHYIRCQFSRPIAEEKVWKYFIQLVIGLEYIHSKKILHRDIKTMNVFLTKNDSVR